MSLEIGTDHDPQHWHDQTRATDGNRINALRAAVLGANDGIVSTAGIVVLPGAAGTVQEIFQAGTPLYYHDEDLPGHQLPRLVLVGVDHWTDTLPAWQLLRSLAAGRPMEEHVHLVDDVASAVELFPAGRRSTDPIGTAP